MNKMAVEEGAWLRSRRAAGWLAAGVAMTLLAGCGSTVQDRGTASGSTGGAPLGGVAQPGGGGADRGASPAAVSPLGPGPGLGPGSTQRPAPGDIPASSGPSPVASTWPQTGFGFTKTTVQIGVATAKDQNTSAAAFGINGVSSTGDPDAQLRAIVDDVNRRGGLLGRRIVLVPHDFKTVDVLTNPAPANQAACADWTQDHHVYAVLEPPVVEGTLLECLAKKKVPIIYAGGVEYPVHYAETYAKYPLFFNIAQMLGERFNRIAIRRLVERHFFSPWDTVHGKPGNASTPLKLGLLAANDHDGDLAMASLKKELARYGMKPTDEIRCPRAIQDAVSCQQGAVLKLRGDGITHIFGVGYPFMINADKQQYYPRYFIASEARVYAENAPPTQLVGSMGEGYVPFEDVESTEYPGDPTPATTYCKKVLRAAGQLANDPSTQWTEMINCDTLYFLKAAVDVVGVLGSGALRKGFDRLGSRSQSAITWGTFFGPGDHASATVVRDIEFRTDIKRYAYVGKTNYGDN